MSLNLSGIGKTSSHPVRWSILVKMCLFPDMNISRSITRSMAILLNGLSSISVICNGYYWTLAFSH